MVYPKSRMEIPSMVFSFLCFSIGYIDAFSIYHQSGMHSLSFVTNSPLSLQPSQSQSQSSSSCLYSSSPTDLVDMGKKLTNAMQETDLFKDIKVEVAPSSSDNRLGLFATQDIKADQVALSVPFDDLIILTAPSVAQKTILKDYLSKEYDGGWTGDVGMIAIGLLLELARSAASEDDSLTKSLPVRKPAIQNFMTTWVQSLPSDPDHPVFSWEEDLQETLEFSSTKKIYRILDDIEEDAQWWEENIWGKNRDIFPETVSVGGIERDCFNLKGFQWAMSMVYSRSIFVDGLIRLVPIADYANHYDGYLSREKKDIEAQEIQNGFFGTFGTSKGVQVKTPKSIKNNNKASVIKKGEEVFVSYGPKSPVDYLIEHGFIPQNMIKIASDPKYKKSSSNQKINQQRGLAEVAELTFSLKESADEDSDEGEAVPFYDDKLDILEFETPIGDNPSQSFDITSIDAIDPLMIQFLRLVNLGDMDAFLLESIFRKEVWDFMADPVSEKNEGKVLNQVMQACQKFLDEKDEASSEENDESLLLSGASSLDGDEEQKKISNEQACAVIRVLERRALTETILNMERESQALDLKEYYQQRRLKSLGLDTEWSDDEANANPDVGWGQTRAPGSGDLDW